MATYIDILNFGRNIKGRYDLLVFLCKWDSDYRKDLIITILAFILFTYSIATIDHWLDYISMSIEAGIIFIQMGTEMSIMPRDYRPSYAGVRYTVKTSSHIAHDELSFLMSGVYPARIETGAKFYDPAPASPLCRQTAMVSDGLNDRIMRRSIPYALDTSKTNFIRSRHQVRYIACRVADKKQHTTNGVKLALYDTVDALLEDRPVRVRKSYYYDALLTAEAFRSRIFRNNLQGETEVFTDLTTYFPVEKHRINGQPAVRFTDDFYQRVSGHIGMTSLLITENNKIAMLYQGSTKAIGADTVVLGGSGSMDYDLITKDETGDLRQAVVSGMAMETAAETGLNKLYPLFRAQTRITGFFRWVDRCGKPEFTGITRAGDVDISALRAIDGDEVVKFEELPVTIRTLDDFQRAMDYLINNDITLSLSSLVALQRMIVIAGYKNAPPGSDQSRIYQDMTSFVCGIAPKA